MKLKVIRKYVDKYTKVLHKPGENVECEATRAKELIEAGVAEKISTPKKKDE